MARFQEMLARPLQDAVDRPPADGTRARLKMPTGRPTESILKPAEREEADLIVMSAHGYGAVSRRLLGSVTAKMVRRTPIPMLAGKQRVLQRKFPERAVLFWSHT